MTPSECASPRGKMIRGWVISCATCNGQAIYWIDAALLKKAEAEAFAEHNGWTLTTVGWQCKTCRGNE